MSRRQRKKRQHQNRQLPLVRASPPQSTPPAKVPPAPAISEPGKMNLDAWKMLSSFALWGIMFLALAVPSGLLSLHLVGRPSPYTLHLSLSLASGILLLLYSLGMRIPEIGRPSAWGWAAMSMFWIFSYRMVLWGIVCTGSEYRCLLSNNLGDVCLHMSLVNSIGLSDLFALKSPWFATESLSYPPGPDLIDAMFVAAGHPAPECMRLTSLVLCFFSAIALWAWGRAFGTAFFLLSGSVIFVWKLADPSMTYDPHWKNLFVCIFAPQRGLQMALPVGAVLLLCCRRFAADGAPASLAVASLCLALLPFSSVHSALALAPVLAVTVMLRPSRKAWICLSASVLALCASAWIVGAWGKTGNLRIESFLGSSIHSDWRVWVVNFGVLLPLMVLSSWRALRCLRRAATRGGAYPEKQETPEIWQAACMLVFFLSFTACLFVSVSAWPWDNTKIMLWSVVGCSPFVWDYVFRRMPLPPRAALLAAVLLPGLPLLAGQFSPENRGYGLFSSEEYNEALSAKTGIPGIKVLAASPDYNHPWLVAGHNFLAGYDGWLWSHGIDYQPVQKDLRKILDGAPGWEETADLRGVSHLLWGPREQRLTGKSSHPASRSWHPVRSGRSGVLYSRH